MPSPIAQDASAARPCQLVELTRYGRVVRTREFASLEALAIAASRASYSLSYALRYGLCNEAVRQLAYSGRGHPLALEELVAWGARVLEARYAARRFPGYVRRRGPVHGIRKWRGGGGYFRGVRTMSETRLNALVLVEDGEVGCRPSRRERNLPHSWDDVPRHRERSWKSQHRGRKSWDRVRVAGKEAL